MKKEKVWLIGVPLLLILLFLVTTGFRHYLNLLNQVTPPLPTPIPITTITSTPYRLTPALSSPTPEIENGWKVYKDPKFTIKYPANWALRSTVFDNENGEKIAEFAPGHITPKEKISCEDFFQRVINGGKDIEAQETTITFGFYGPPTIISKKTINLKGKTWSLLVKETLYSSGSTKEGGIWYPHTYCTQEKNRLFIINFYETSLPAKNTSLFQKILSTFKFN